LADDLAVVLGRPHPFSQSFAKGFFGIAGDLAINLGPMIVIVTQRIVGQAGIKAA